MNTNEKKTDTKTETKNKSEKPLLNVLIRTSNRPNGFERLLKSIKKQTYKQVRVIVSTDNPKTFAYAQEHELVDHIVEVEPQPDAGRSPHNLYLNELLKEVKEGYIIIIDDDDHIPDRYAFSKIMKQVEHEKLNIVRMKWPNDRVIPEDEYFEQIPFVRKHIGMPCLVFHSDLAEFIEFDAQRAADFRAANRLAELTSVNWIDHIVVNTGNTRLNGKAQDID